MTFGSVAVDIINAVQAYNGNDILAINGRELFENKMNISMYYSVQMYGDNIDMASNAFDFVTSDANSVEIAKVGLSPDVGLMM